MGRFTPTDPVALGSSVPCPNASLHADPVLSAVVGDNAELFAQVARLWITNGDVVVDATYGKGVFWRSLPGVLTHRFDLVTGDDLRALPLDSESADVLVLDPPYRPTHGSKGRYGLADDFGLGTTALDTIDDVIGLYRDGIIEAGRVLRPGGRLMVKCQDLSYNHRLHLVSLDVLRLIRGTGFDLADQFILVNKARMPSSVWAKQERARRAHSVLWIAIRR